MRVPYALSFYDDLEIDAVLSVLKSGNTMAGSNMETLEKNISSSFGHKYGVMCNSGSSALTLGLGAFDLPKGSEVITPALTFATTVATIIQADLVPVLIDSEVSSLNVDVNNLEAALSDKTKAIVIPDLMGNFCDWDYVKDFARQHNLLVLHDSADTIGHTLNGTPVGTRADISTTSLYGAHIINGAGNGGMVVTSNIDFANRMRKLRSWGRESALFGESEDASLIFNCKIDHIDYDQKFVFSDVGYNIEGSEISAAFANVQFSKLEEFKKRRRYIFDKHAEFVKKHEGTFIVPTEVPGAEVVWYAFPIILNKDVKFTRTELQVFLESKDIQTRPVFAGNIARQPGFKNQNMRISGDLSGADYVMEYGLVIGCHQGMNDEHADWVHKSLEEFLSKNS